MRGAARRLRWWGRARSIAASAVALLASLLIGSAARGDDSAEVRTVFDAYKAALMNGDGAAAVGLVDADTFRYFEELRHAALQADESEVRAKPFIDRLLVVTLRHEMPRAEIEGMTLESLLQHAVEAGWIARQTVAQLEMGEVLVEGDVATAEARTSAGEITAADVEGSDPLRYRFVREDGAWKFGFASLVDSLNEVVRRFTEQLGTDQDELIFLLVERLSGRRVLPEVWSGPAAEVPETDAGPATPPD